MRFPSQIARDRAKNASKNPPENTTPQVGDAQLEFSDVPMVRYPETITAQDQICAAENIPSPPEVSLHPVMLFCSQSQLASPKIHLNLGATERLALGVDTMVARAALSQGFRTHRHP